MKPPQQTLVMKTMHDVNRQENLLKVGKILVSFCISWKAPFTWKEGFYEAFSLEGTKHPTFTFWDGSLARLAN